MRTLVFVIVRREGGGGEGKGEKEEAYYGPRMNCVVERGIIRIRPSDITIATDT